MRARVAAHSARVRAGLRGLRHGVRELLLAEYLEARRTPLAPRAHDARHGMARPCPLARACARAPLAHRSPTPAISTAEGSTGICAAARQAVTAFALELGSGEATSFFSSDRGKECGTACLWRECLVHW